ncbi:hypothetical protein E1B28_008918 [Marasmius oreades]|uniref:Proteasome assembly chaperone 3 n=1 Tax=Marasmius oreades TaxID=181124 RepID=A0A9P7USV4_9AGAR|nr:uncharacterized protein E1B28_008918 [Marasmius oreades]KAG7092570.1 hypothetical protein E1B28_008918 [Marasmius oreades]
MSTSSITIDLNDVPTGVSIQTFKDSVLVLVSQVGKVGNLIQVTLPPTTPLLPAATADPLESNTRQLPPIPAATHLTSLLGHAPSEYRHTLHNLYASQIASLIWNMAPEDPTSQARKTIIVGIALQKSKTNDDTSSPTETEKETFTGVMRTVQELLEKGA